MISWSALRAAHPDGLVMAQPDRSRVYGSNPYAGYVTGRPSLSAGKDPPHGTPPLERVVRMGDRAWPLTRLARAGRIAEGGVVLTWQAGQASALNSREIASGGRGRQCPRAGRGRAGCGA